MGGIALAFMDVAIALAGIALKTLGQLHNVTHIEQSRDLIAFRFPGFVRDDDSFFFFITTCCTCIKFILFFSII